MSAQISRRTLAKALAASGTVASLNSFAPAESLASGPLVTHSWRQVHPGVWRATKRKYTFRRRPDSLNSPTAADSGANIL